MTRVILALIILALTSCSRPAVVSEEEALTTPEATNGETPIAMAQEAQSHIGLEVTPASMQRLTEYLSVTGTVQPIDSRVIHVRPGASGRLVSVAAKIGDRVSAGQTLVTFENIDAADTAADYRAAQAELSRLNVQLAVARQQVERNRRLVDIGAISTREYELSQGEERTLAAAIQVQESAIAGLSAKLTRLGVTDAASPLASTTVIRAPFAGVILAAEASPGEVVGPDSELFTIADISQVWVQAEVYEKDLGRIEPGSRASIRLDTYPDREFSGRVTYISDVLDAQTRTAKVRCEVANEGSLLKLDMFATVLLPTTFSRDALAIPAEAVQQIENRSVVFVRVGPETFEPKTVQTGRIIGGTAEILSGLNPGESVVTTGAFHLKSIVLSEEIGEDH